MQRVDPVWRAQLDGFIADGSRLGEACLQSVATRGKASALGAAPLVLAQASAAPEGRVYQRGVASWYGPGFDGLPTASGERFNRRALTAAHRTLPLGSRAQIINLGNGRSVDVVVNDRGPYVGGRIIDVSQGAAEQLGFVGAGTARVEIRLRY
ncbi:MAG: septal ring lytic transglycosylase RlpA family protein [Proteobacteria bacterium]|nr:septal ring lytic transglycosylase RlpA family protein [Pseudomonadota bacterium]